MALDRPPTYTDLLTAVGHMCREAVAARNQAVALDHDPRTHADVNAVVRCIAYVLGGNYPAGGRGSEAARVWQDVVTSVWAALDAVAPRTPGPSSGSGPDVADMLAALMATAATP